PVGAVVEYIDYEVQRLARVITQQMHPWSAQGARRIRVVRQSILDPEIQVEVDRAVRVTVFNLDVRLGREEVVCSHRDDKVREVTRGRHAIHAHVDQLSQVVGHGVAALTFFDVTPQDGLESGGVSLRELSYNLEHSLARLFAAVALKAVQKPVRDAR